MLQQMHTTHRHAQWPLQMSVSAWVCHRLDCIACDTTLEGTFLSNMIWDDWKLFDLKVYSLKLSALRDHQENLIASLRGKKAGFLPQMISDLNISIETHGIGWSTGRLISLGNAIFWWHFQCLSNRGHKIDQNLNEPFSEVDFGFGLTVDYGAKQPWRLTL